MSRRWTCPYCRTLLGLRDGPHLEIRYKTARYVVTAAKSVVATCRNCGRRVKAD